MWICLYCRSFIDQTLGLLGATRADKNSHRVINTPGRLLGGGPTLCLPAFHDYLGCAGRIACFLKRIGDRQPMMPSEGGFPNNRRQGRLTPRTAAIAGVTADWNSQPP